MSRFVVASKFEDGRGYFTGSFGVSRSHGLIAPNAAFDGHRRAFAMAPVVAATMAKLLTELATACGEPRCWFFVEIDETETPPRTAGDRNA